LSAFTPTQGQQEALDVIRKMPERFPTGGGVAVISGYAGTGKTTLLKVLAEENPFTFVLTPTGKAAVRVRQATGCRAMTIHRWQYEPKKDEKSGEYRFSPRESSTLEIPPNQTLIIDEASMIPHTVWEHLRFFCQALALNIVLIGDGFQLAPVETDPSKKAFSVFAPDFKADFKVNLTEVLRQALESPIIRISTLIRTESDITGPLTQLDIVTEKRLDEALIEMQEKKGVILCHRNQTRHSTNAKVRQLRGLPSDEIQNDEPLLVMKNNYRLDIFNGEVFPVTNLGKVKGPVPVVDRYKNMSMFMHFREAAFKSDEGGELPEPANICVEEVFGSVGKIDTDAIAKASSFLMREAYSDLDPALRPPHVHANFGYALTCHKAQGSEWGEAVVIMEDSVRLGTAEGRRFLYTALTRARNRVRVCWL